MAGHNKWSKVKHIKGALNAKRGKIFSRLAKEIPLAAKAGGGDSGADARLRSAITAARAQNMPDEKLVFVLGAGVAVTDPHAAQQVLRLCEALEEGDDVQNVCSNFDMADELPAQASA
jgi:transcriptional/translational regulatory protein YebC/TACO1